MLSMNEQIMVKEVRRQVWGKADLNNEFWLQSCSWKMFTYTLYSSHCFCFLLIQQAAFLFMLVNSMRSHPTDSSAPSPPCLRSAQKKAEAGIANLGQVTLDSDFYDYLLQADQENEGLRDRVAELEAQLPPDVVNQSGDNTASDVSSVPAGSSPTGERPSSTDGN